MNSGKSIKVQRKESILLELLNEAFATLNDSRINSLNVLSVVCSKGASDCKVYLEKSFLISIAYLLSFPNPLLSKNIHQIDKKIPYIEA